MGLALGPQLPPLDGKSVIIISSMVSCSYDVDEDDEDHYQNRSKINHTLKDFLEDALPRKIKLNEEGMPISDEDSSEEGSGED